MCYNCCLADPQTGRQTCFMSQARYFCFCSVKAPYNKCRKFSKEKFQIKKLIKKLGLYYSPHFQLPLKLNHLFKDALDP